MQVKIFVVYLYALNLQLKQMKNRSNTNTMETTIQKKNREIIGATYHKIRHEIFSIFRQAGIEENICEDLVQDVFLKILGLDVIPSTFRKVEKKFDFLKPHCSLSAVMVYRLYSPASIRRLNSSKR